MMPLLLLSPTAHAGTYLWQTTDANGHVTAQSPTYTVGKISFRGGPGPDQDRPYNWSYQGCGISDGRGLATDISCAGANQATFTWQSDSTKTLATVPPPDQVIVKETTYARTIAAGTVASPPTGGCTDGFGGSQDLIVPPGGQSGGVTLSRTRYSTHPGGQTVTLPSCEPTAHSANNSEESRVSYSANIFPLTVSLGGTYNPSTGDYRVLTGQQITATLTGIPTNSTVNQYTWTQPSATCFKTYNENAASNQLVALGSTDLTGPVAGSTGITPLAFYDRAGESLTVTCNVSLTAPDGTSLSITATSPSVSVLKPSVTHWGIAQGYVQYQPNTDNGPAYGLYGNLSATGDSSNGMVWSNVTVSVPSPFSGNGQCTFTQLVNPDRRAYINGNSTPLVLNNGILGLDGSFDYGSRWDVTGMGSSVDSPNQPLYYKAGLTEINANDSFTTYVMYQPSGGVWVPLQKFSWTWGETLTWQPQTSQFSLTASYPAATGSAPAYTPGAALDPPQWTVVH